MHQSSRTSDRHPAAFAFIFWGELAERASFYGMRTLLALYLVETMGYGPGSASVAMQLFLAACFVTPLLGGWVADRWLGKYRTIAGFAVPYVIGQLVLAWVPTRAGLLIALTLLALGSGAIKPNTSTLLGEVYEAERRSHLLSRAFSYFYAAINLGSALASLALPVVRNHYGYRAAFTIPAVLMGVAFLLFVAGRRHYARPEALARVRGARTAEGRDGGSSVRGLLGIFGLIAVFWFVYDQTASTWIFFARDHLDLELLRGIRISADQVQVVNPIAILVLTPVFNALWSRVRIADTTKMLAGFGITCGAMVAMACTGYAAGDGRTSGWWVVGATFVITLAELCINVVGLELAYREAGPRAKSAVTAAFLLTVTVGDLAGSVVDPLYDHIAAGPYFLLQAVIVAIAAVVFVRVARRFNARMVAADLPVGRPGHPGEGTKGNADQLRSP
jgi:POT family proton-dependent oligopeptide transporter